MFRKLLAKYLRRILNVRCTRLRAPIWASIFDQILRGSLPSGKVDYAFRRVTNLDVFAGASTCTARCIGLVLENSLSAYEYEYLVKQFRGKHLSFSSHIPINIFYDLLQILVQRSNCMHGVIISKDLSADGVVSAMSIRQRHVID